MARNKKPVYQEGTHAIERGLYVRKSGNMASFFVRVQKDGMRHDIGLGSVSKVSEDEARRKAMLIRADVERGATPWIKTKKKALPPTFEEYFPSAFERYKSSCGWKRESAADERKHLIERYAMPYLKSVRITDITHVDLIPPLSSAWSKSVVLGERLRFLLQKIFSRAVADGYLTDNPARWNDLLEFHLPSRKRKNIKHHTAMSFEECREFLQLILLKDVPSARALLVVVLTARRISEVLLSKWDDFDLDAGIWVVPDEHMKVSRSVDRRVPLPKQLIEQMRRWQRSGEYVFYTSQSERLKRWPVLRSLQSWSEGKPTIHGFRSTFIDWCAENDVPIEVAEKCLDHESGGQVRRAYQRSDLLEQRREVLQRYADALFEE